MKFINYSFILFFYLAIGIDEIEQKSQSYLSKLDNYVSSLDDESFDDSADEKNPKENENAKPEPKPEETDSETSDETDEFDESD